MPWSPLPPLFRPKLAQLPADLAAGGTLAVALIPDAMAGAVLAGVAPAHGLYAAVVGVVLGALTTGSVFMTVSITGALSVATGAALAGRGDVGLLVALTALVAIFQLLFALLRFGSLTRFVSNAVMTGFLSGIGLLIVLGQLGDLTGWNSKAGHVLARAWDLLPHLDRLQLAPLAIGLATMVSILLLRRTRFRVVAMLLALVLAAALAALVRRLTGAEVELVADLPRRFPGTHLPALAALPGLLLPALGLAVIGLVQSAGVSESHPNPDGRYASVNRDFFGQGLANLASSLFGGMPVGGSVSCTALLVGAGARSRWANLLAGVMVAVAIALVGRALALLPLAALAGMLTLAGIQVLDPARIALVLRAGWPASLAFVLTLLATLSLPLHLAVLVGVASSALLHVYRSASAVSLRQVVADGAPAGSLVGVCERDPPPVLPSDAITALCPYGSLFFAAARALEEQLPRVGEARCPVVILLLRGQQDAGSTFLAVMVRYARRLRQAGGRLFVAGVSVDLRRQLDRTGTTAVIGEDAVFEATPRYGQSYLSARGAAEAWLAQGR